MRASRRAKGQGARTAARATKRFSTDLTPSERLTLIAAALDLLEKLYVHLPLKRAMYAVNPIQRLKLLRRRIKQPKLFPVSDHRFFVELLSIFTQLRDLHTNFILPEPFRSSTAYLPFRVEECSEKGEQVFIVSQIMAPDSVDPGVLPDDPEFERGVTITHWNGIPMHAAVAINAEREAGSNAAARHAQGLLSMTIRWMGMSIPPDEEWVDITYLPIKKPQSPKEVRFQWHVFRAGASDAEIIASASADRAYCLGLDARAEVERHVRRFLFKARRGRPASRYFGGNVKLAVSKEFSSVFPSVGDVKTQFGTFAYLRIATFNVRDDRAFLNEFIRIAENLSPNGLILDVRENGGGLITAGERLLQLLTPKPINPARLHFLNSDMTLALCEMHDFIKPWSDSIAQAVETGADFSQGLPLSPLDKYNDVGQKYQGPIVLITDALCYSTTDIFAAGFQDHEIGTILGIHDNTGAGGANVWDYSLISELAGDPTHFPVTLPRDASFRFAVRRVTRVGKNAGVPIEDLGVQPDATHRVTRLDLLERNVDLINAAARLLHKKKKFRLRGIKKKRNQYSVTCKEIDRLDVYLDDRPFQSLAVKSRARAKSLLLKIPRLGGAKELRLFGFDKGKLAVATRVPA